MLFSNTNHRQHVESLVTPQCAVFAHHTPDAVDAMLYRRHTQQSNFTVHTGSTVRALSPRMTCTRGLCSGLQWNRVVHFARPSRWLYFCVCAHTYVTECLGEWTYEVRCILWDLVCTQKGEYVHIIVRIFILMFTKTWMHVCNCVYASGARSNWDCQEWTRGVLVCVRVCACMWMNEDAKRQDKVLDKSEDNRGRR